MTHPFEPKKLQFYVTIPAPCPYLSDRMERKVFTQLDPLSGPHLNDWLTQLGFRRSQNVIYRPACEHCNACKSLRVRADEFRPSKSNKRVSKLNADLTIEACEPLATDEQFALLSDYLQDRHSGGGMSDMDYDRYEHMVEECGSRTDILEYRDADRRLLACSLIDILADGFSMVYSFYAPDQVRRSLGTFMILDRIRAAKEELLPFVYLGYWVKGSPKMAYKARFKPHEVLINDLWVNPEEIQDMDI